jgi:DNA helicase II / ATP-dependent DNA helicase PcrA
MTPTPEQLAIVTAAKTTKDNLIISALAGAAKTSTLILIAKALSSTSILCLAFNKRIAVEMSERLPGNCQSMTLNSLGHRVWGSTIGKRLIVNTRKNYEILSALIEELRGKEKEQAFDQFADMLKAIGFGKSCGYIPTDHYPQAKRLMDDDEFFNHLDEEPDDLFVSLVRRASIESIRRGFEGIIDFDDQILLPTVFQSSFPQYPLVMIDEAQDLSALNHATLRRLARNRLIAVGDECQAIYGFRGAHQDSMTLLQREFNMKQLILSVSFRCPIAVVEAARWRAPHMQYPEWAKAGSVRHAGHWAPATLPDSAAIICRNNAPIFSLALKLIRARRRPEIIGNDIGKNLIKILKKFGDASLPQASVLVAITEWEEEKLKKSRSKTSVHDQAECLRVFAREGQNLGAIIAFAEALMAQTGPIKMMTGHKSKGLEFDNVFFLNEDLIKLEEPQERNLRYVIQTRAKETLTYISTELMETDEQEEV